MGTCASFSPESDAPCYNPRMTRAQALARRAAGTLRENCVVVITDGPTIGTTGNTSPTEIELNPTSPTELGLTARVHQTFDNSAWAGLYDIDAGGQGSIIQLTDSSGNTVKDIDVASQTVETQWPWHLGANLGVGFFRDNYAEDSTFTGVADAATRFVQGNKFINTNMDWTGWTSGTMLDNEIVGGLIHHITATGTWQRNVIRNSTANFTGNSTLLESTLINGGNVSSTGTSAVTINGSLIDSATVRNDSSNGAITIQQESEISGLASVINDAGSFKNLTITGSDVYGSFILRGQGGTVTKAISIASSKLGGIGGGQTETMLFMGDSSANINICEISQNVNKISVDGLAALQWAHVKWLAGAGLTVGPLATNNQWTSSIFEACVATILGPGENNFSTSISSTIATNLILSTVAATTGSMQIQSALINNATVRSTGPAGLLIDLGSKLSGSCLISQDRTAQPTGAFEDRISQTTVESGRIEFASTVASPNTHNVARSRIHASSLNLPNGRLRIDGTSDGVTVDACDIAGEVTITDVPFGALNGPTAFHDNHVSPSCKLLYTAGDNVAKQIRGNHIEGDSSSLLITNLTGSAGVGLADVFSCRVANQSTLSVDGARVVGQPVRSVIVENGSTVTIDPNGSALQFLAQNNADFTSGPFVHFDSAILGAFTKVAAAANNNNLCNKSFDDFV